MNYNEKLEINPKILALDIIPINTSIDSKKLFRNINKLETNYDNEKVLNIFQKEFKRYDQFKNTCPKHKIN